ncbi:hypothetical protein [Gracilimonas sp.]
MKEIDSEIACFVFRTSLIDKRDVEQISVAMNTHPDIAEWSVDLENWEKVLRVESSGIDVNGIKLLLRSKGFYCSEMEI